MKIEVVPSTVCHIFKLRNSMREADRKEIELLGYTALQGLLISYRDSVIARTALVDGVVAAMWGITHMESPWLLTGKAIESVPVFQFMRYYKEGIKEMLSKMPRMENYVAADYEKSIRCLRLAGFRVGSPEPYGAGLFRRVSMGDV